LSCQLLFLAVLLLVELEILQVQSHYVGTFSYRNYQKNEKTGRADGTKYFNILPGPVYNMLGAPRPFFAIIFYLCAGIASFTLKSHISEIQSTKETFIGVFEV